jgi:hypothetical protein
MVLSQLFAASGGGCICNASASTAACCTTCLTTWHSAGLPIDCDGHSAICSWVRMFSGESRRNSMA